MTGDPDAPPETLSELLSRAVAAYGDAPAIVTAGETMSYRQLEAASARMAKALLAQGVGKGTRIALLAGGVPLWIISLFAGARIGALVIPISTLSAPAELAHVLRHSDADTLIVGRHYVGRDYGDTIAKALPSIGGASGRGPLRLQEAPYLRSIWLDDAAGLPWAGSVSELLKAGDSDASLTDELFAEIASEVTPSDDGVIIYTSGSTALPKAVLHSQGGISRHAKLLADHHNLPKGGRVLCLLPMFWVGGLNILLEALISGSAVVLPEGPSTPQVVAALRDLSIDRLWGWPAQLKAIRETMEAEGLDMSRIGGLRVETMPDGSPLQRERIPNSLGMTESFGPHCAEMAGTLLPDHRLGAFGRPIGAGERRVADPTTGEVLGPGQLGELQLRGGALMKGYYKKERSEVFTPDGFFSTNDLVRIEPDGYMYLEGRTGDMLKTKGANVSRLEVEVALRSLPQVAEAVVCGLQDAELGQRVVAAVVPEPGQTVTEADLLAGLRDKLAGYKLPTNILVIDRDDLIWTASGKIRIPEMGKLISERLGLAA